MDFSVLMSVYVKENPDYLRLAISSVIEQTLMPSEIVIVKDGSLTEDLDAVIESFEAKFPKLLNVISLSTNLGLGHALRIGVEQCKYDLIARMDSDDICHQERFEKQLNYLIEHPEVDVLGSWIQEFDTDSTRPTYIRKVPASSNEIEKYSKKRNPLNHMTVMFRKQSILSAGSYQPFLWNEDYFLWARLIKNGFRIENLNETLVYARAGDSMFQRRGGVNYVVNEVKLQREFYLMNFITIPEFIINVITRSLVRLFPNTLRGIIYKKFLRQAS